MPLAGWRAQCPPAASSSARLDPPPPHQPLCLGGHLEDVPLPGLSRRLAFHMLPELGRQHGRQAAQRRRNSWLCQLFPLLLTSLPPTGCSSPLLPFCVTSLALSATSLASPPLLPLSCLPAYRPPLRSRALSALLSGLPRDAHLDPPHPHPPRLISRSGSLAAPTLACPAPPQPRR